MQPTPPTTTTTPLQIQTNSKTFKNIQTHNTQTAQLNRDKVALENRLEAEQEYVTHRLQKQLATLAAEKAALQRERSELQRQVRGRRAEGGGGGCDWRAAAGKGCGQTAHSVGNACLRSTQACMPSMPQPPALPATTTNITSSSSPSKHHHHHHDANRSATSSAPSSASTATAPL